MLEIQTKVGKKKPGWGKLFVGPNWGTARGLRLSLPHIPVNAIWLCLLFGKSCLNKGKLPKKNSILRSVGLCKECSKNLCVTY